MSKPTILPARGGEEGIAIFGPFFVTLEEKLLTGQTENVTKCRLRAIRYRRNTITPHKKCVWSVKINVKRASLWNRFGPLRIENFSKYGTCTRNCVCRSCPWDTLYLRVRVYIYVRIGDSSKGWSKNLPCNGFGRGSWGIWHARIIRRNVIYIKSCFLPCPW